VVRHYVCFPSADPTKGHACALEWLTAGYIPMVMADLGPWVGTHGAISNLPYKAIQERYPFPGYYRVINEVVDWAFKDGAHLVTCIGDDMGPPKQGAEFHSTRFLSRFPSPVEPGLMQCTGDRQGSQIEGRVAAERICGSPTFNRGWNDRAFQGHGPFGDYGFKSFYCDEMLYEVGRKLGVLYQEPELSIDHKHWSFLRSKKEWWHEKAQKNWTYDKELFESLKANGFPGSEVRA
jgi:hypothetical protein